jgi:hypothetical protein
VVLFLEVEEFVFEGFWLWLMLVGDCFFVWVGVFDLMRWGILVKIIM